MAQEWIEGQQFEQAVRKSRVESCKYLSLFLQIDSRYNCQMITQENSPEVYFLSEVRVMVQVYDNIQF